MLLSQVDIANAVAMVFNRRTKLNLKGQILLLACKYRRPTSSYSFSREVKHHINEKSSDVGVNSSGWIFPSLQGGFFL